MIVRWTDENGVSVVPVAKAVEPVPTELVAGAVGRV